MKRQISLLLAALLLLTLLVGCGGSGSAKPAATGYAYDTDASTAPEAPMEQDSKFNITAAAARAPQSPRQQSITATPKLALIVSDLGLQFGDGFLFRHST